MITANAWIPFFYDINFFPMPARTLPKDLSTDEIVQG
jgi:hypothetical protein